MCAQEDQGQVTFGKIKNLRGLQTVHIELGVYDFKQPLAFRPRDLYTFVGILTAPLVVYLQLFNEGESHGGLEVFQFRHVVIDSIKVRAVIPVEGLENLRENRHIMKGLLHQQFDRILHQSKIQDLPDGWPFVMIFDEQV
jgi:hypothetical protein